MQLARTEINRFLHAFVYLTAKSSLPIKRYCFAKAVDPVKDLRQGKLVDGTRWEAMEVTNGVKPKDELAHVYFFFIIFF